jgi:ComF family protein
MLFAFRDSLFAALFPQPCFCCDLNLSSASLGNSCGKCWEATEIFDGDTLRCSKCGRPEPTGNRAICRQCESHEYDSAHSVGIYSNALRAAVVGLKTQPYVSRKLARLLLNTFERSGIAPPTMLVPVPLSKQRRLERGFNQAEIIARALVKPFGLRIDSRSLIRTKHAAIHRAGMDEKARDLSVRDSFAVVRPNLVKEQNVLLVDDVLTTGATASYCARALKNAGAVRVDVLTIARAV